MRKFLLISAILFSTIIMRAQEPGTLTLNLDAGYNFASTVNLDGGTIKPQGALQYGGGFEFYTFWDQSVEVKYLRSDPTVNVSYFLNNIRKDYSANGSQNYILLGWNKYFGNNPEAKAVPFGGIGLGMNILGNGEDTATKFSWDAKLGVKIRTNSAVSLKLQAYLEHSLSAVGTDIWYGWYGAYPVTTYAGLWQFGLGGVLCFDLNRRK